MSLTVDFLSILLIATLFQGLFFLSVLLFKYKLGDHSQRYLFVIMLVLMWYAAEFFSVRQVYDVPFNLFYGTRYGSWLFVGPFFLFYVLSIIGKPPRWRNVFVHLAPALIFVIVFPLLTGDAKSLQQVTYGMLSTFGPFGGKPTTIEIISTTIFILQFFHMLTYLLISLRAVRVYEKNLKGNYSSLDVGNIRWLKGMTLSLLLVLVLVTAFLGLFFTTMAYNRDLDYLYVLPISLLMYAIGYKLTGAQWPQTSSDEESTGKYAKSGLKDDQAAVFQQKLGDYLTTTKPYLNNELKLHELAANLGMPVHHLSQVINEKMNTTFFDLVNWHRVEEAKRLIRTDRNSSLLEIGFKAGFNNKTSFTNAFRKNTGLTPMAYRKQEESRTPDGK